MMDNFGCTERGYRLQKLRVLRAEARGPRLLTFIQLLVYREREREKERFNRGESCLRLADFSLSFFFSLSHSLALDAPWVRWVLYHAAYLRCV